MSGERGIRRDRDKPQLWLGRNGEGRRMFARSQLIGSGLRFGQVGEFGDGG